MILKELIGNNKNTKLAELIAYLILEKGMRYQDIFGETITGYVEIDGEKKEVVLYREGIPLSALIELSKYLAKFEKAKARRIRR